MTSSEIYFAGLVLIGIVIIVAVAAIPVFFITGKKLNNQLENDYGKKGRQDIR